MVVDGKAIASDMLAATKVQAESLAAFGVPTLAIITCAPNFETVKYLALKQRKAAAAGVTIAITELSATVTTDEVVAAVTTAALTAHGVVVQLPLPAHLDPEVILAAIPVTRDPDGFCYGSDKAACRSPVVVAIDEIAQRHGVMWAGKQVVVVGAGRLVGKPAAHYTATQGAQVTVLTKDTPNFAVPLAQAEVIISGAGQPGLITSAMVRAGVMVFDAGTSEDGGVLRGDVNPEVAKKAALFTPVPGGIGPVTVAALLRNTVDLAARAWHQAD